MTKNKQMGIGSRPIRPARVLQAGFTLAEVLVAAAILAVAMLAIVTMIPTAASTVDYNAGMARATALAQQRIEQLKNVPFTTLVAMDAANVPPNLPASEDTTVAEGNDSFTRQVWVQVNGAAPRREAVVTLMLTWATPIGTKTLRVDTVITE
ncbi:MAG: prepilin-type N-terminal cleavage/methylation domain-containing protein [Candidatus Methylomirabilales bacterium]